MPAATQICHNFNVHDLTEKYFGVDEFIPMT